MTLNVPVGSCSALGVASAAYPGPWPLLVAALLGVLTRRVCQLLAQRQRNRALMAVVLYAPLGTVVIHDERPHGPMMAVWVGDRRRALTVRDGIMRSGVGRSWPTSSLDHHR